MGDLIRAVHEYPDAAFWVGVVIIIIVFKLGNVISKVARAIESRRKD
jgi:hypothetical protein